MYSHSMPIVTEALTKIYYPEKVVLDKINLTVAEGETIGILGNNGAGKTTLLRILATLLIPSYGAIEIFGLDPRFDATEIKKLIGYLPERFSFYPYFSVSDILDFFEKLSPIKRTDQEELRDQVIKLLDMESYLNVRISALSKGMLHKVGLAITLIHDPPILLLDEPTSGLDPLVRTQVRKILINLTSDFEKTILVSSHILEDVDAVCDRVFFLEDGKMLHKPFWLSDLRQKFSKLRRLDIRSKSLINSVSELKDFKKILYTIPNPRGIEIYCKEEQESIISNHLKDVLKLKPEISSHVISLEDIYILNHAKINWSEFLT
ncbi:MAG: ABC transporter ATP-binding protein [Candidatus Hodarchaeales archaeon]